tara:strand:- start:47 stop:1201 length:1155 start_codon:yes stop_codon:yes gene_type:complete
MATQKGVWNLQQVRDKQLQDLWSYQIGTLYGWGYNAYGELGQNNRTAYSSPVQVPGTTWSITENGDPKYGLGIASGIKSDGTMWIAGENPQGQLAQNNRTKYSSPVQIGSGTDWKNTGVHKTGSCTFGTKTDGTLWVWGRNDDGELGQNNRIQYSSPVQIPGTNWKYGMGGNDFAVAIRTDGTLWAMGRSVYGELGQNDRTRLSSPVQIPGTTWSNIYPGRYGTLAMKTDGTLWGWGDNGLGQLGDNSNVKRSSPVQVPGTTWKQVSACGSGAVMATKTDGTLWGWGLNNSGELGLGTRVDNEAYSSPIQIPGTTWAEVVCNPSSANSMARKTDGTIWSWGYNSQGQLGQNDKTTRSSPIQIGTDTDWSAVTATYYSFLAYKNA